jgi:hypothetical protein
MRYPMPNHPCDLEIPDDWLAEAGMDGLTPKMLAYRSTAGAGLIPLTQIEPPYRSPAVEKDWRGFDRVRMVSILRGFVAGVEIEPVPLLTLPAGTFLFPAPYRYRVKDGFHRFYASVAAGFQCLPGAIV